MAEGKEDKRQMWPCSLLHTFAELPSGTHTNTDLRPRGNRGDTDSSAVPSERPPYSESSVDS